jgi:Sulfotransferase domain
LAVSPFDKVLGIARRVKRFLRNPKKTLERRLRDPEDVLKRRSIKSKKHEFRQVRNEFKTEKREEYEQLKNRISKIEIELEGKKRETERIAEELIVAKDPGQISELEERKRRLQRERSRLRTELITTKKKARAENIGRKMSKKRAQQEIFQLERELGTAKKKWARDQETGALPDFVVIGERKCGTTFLYHLLTQHPLVEPAASKELHYFDALFDEDVEWYKQCFPAPRWVGGHRTITGEASPYMANRLAPARMARVVPGVRLIALLRNPVDRTYSDFQQVVRKGRESRTFEEAIGAAEKEWSSGGGGQVPEGGDPAHLARRGYLSRSIYVEHLLRWSEFFPREQLLVLKSEEFFESRQETLKKVFEFLGLPEWELQALEMPKKRDKRNTGGYEGEMDPSTRQRLEEYFEPYNRRLYDFLGVDLGW